MPINLMTNGSLRRRDLVISQWAVLCSVALLYLALVALSAAHQSVGSYSSSKGRLALAFGDWTGARNNFGFFAPSVASQVRVQYVLEPSDGVIHNFESVAQTPEFSLRMHTMLVFFPKSGAEDLLSRSLAAYALSSAPQARAVSLNVDIFDLPTMGDFAKGAAPFWKPYFRTRFALASR